MKKWIPAALCAVLLVLFAVSAVVDIDMAAVGESVTIGNYTEYDAPESEEEEAADSGLFGKINAANSFINTRIAGGLMMCILLVGTGVFFTIRLGGFHIRHFGHILRNAVGRIFRRDVSAEGEVTPFQALCTALAATVGTGNIAGVTGAIVLGGPGAVFWMWVAAFFGMCTKYAEIVLAVRFRERSNDGNWMGGPMYYIQKGLGENWKWLSCAFAVCGALAAFGIGSMTQINTISGTVVMALDSLGAGMGGTSAETILRWSLGIVAAVAAGAVLLGGIKRLGSVTEKLVPVMSCFYILGALTVIIVHADKVGMVFASIFRAAFTREAAFGGVTGFVIMNAMKKGVGRGVFSNEAGMGSAPIAHAATSESDPVRQGFMGVFEVFTDTIVICTLTALAVLTSDVVPWGNASLAGAQTTILSFATVFGSKAASIFIAVAILCFSFSTILSWSLYGIRCFQYLTRGRWTNIYIVVYLATVIPGSVLDLSVVWNIAENLNGFMAIPNLIAILALSGIVAEETRRYFSAEKTKWLHR